MSNEIITLLSPILADIGKVFIFVSISLMVINLAKNAFTKGELKL